VARASACSVEISGLRIPGLRVRAGRSGHLDISSYLDVFAQSKDVDINVATAR
jgi:hypothetical protein